MSQADNLKRVDDLELALQHALGNQGRVEESLLKIQSLEVEVSSLREENKNMTVSKNILAVENSDLKMRLEALIANPLQGDQGDLTLQLESSKKKLTAINESHEEQSAYIKELEEQVSSQQNRINDFTTAQNEQRKESPKIKLEFEDCEEDPSDFPELPVRTRG